jgi:predicted nucleotidyltransferase
MMEKFMTKTVKKYGNSGGVYLPSSWIGGMVEISLVSKPARPEEDLPLAFAGRMQHVISMFLYGSYARGEAEEGSDIDVIVVTDSHTKDMEVPQGLKERGYDVRIMSADRLKRNVERDVLFNKSLEDAKVIFNDGFLNELRSIKPKRDIGDRIAMARSSLNIMKNLFEPGKDNSNLIYPLVMRMKEMQLIQVNREAKRYSLDLLEDRLLDKGLSLQDCKKLMAYYRAVRNGKKPGKAGISDRILKLALETLEEMIDDEKKQKA